MPDSSLQKQKYVNMAGDAVWHSDRRENRYESHKKLYECIVKRQ